MPVIISKSSVPINLTGTGFDEVYTLDLYLISLYKQIALGFKPGGSKFKTKYKKYRTKRHIELSALTSRKENMNLRVQTPTLDSPWDFDSWDNGKQDTPPWVYRHFWYHSGDGDYIVIVWRDAFDEGGYDILSGEIHRTDTLTRAWDILQGYRTRIESPRDKPLGYHDGGMIFRRHAPIKRLTIGEEFPGLLPSDRW